MPDLPRLSTGLHGDRRHTRLHEPGEQTGPVARLAERDRHPGAAARLPIADSALVPEVDDAHADLGEQLPGQRQADADHAGRVAVHAVDEPAAETVQGERAGHREWFAGRQVGVEFGRARRGEPHRGALHPDRAPVRRSAGQSDHRVSGDEFPGAARHGRPARARHVHGVRLADHLAAVRTVHHQHRVAADHDRVRVRGRDRRHDRFGFRLGQRGNQIGGRGLGQRRGDRVFVHTGHMDDRLDPGRAQHGQPGRRRGSKYKAHSASLARPAVPPASGRFADQFGRRVRRFRLGLPGHQQARDRADRQHHQRHDQRAACRAGETLVERVLPGPGQLPQAGHVCGSGGSSARGPRRATRPDHAATCDASPSRDRPTPTAAARPAPVAAPRPCPAPQRSARPAPRRPAHPGPRAAAAASVRRRSQGVTGGYPALPDRRESRIVGEHG